MQFNICIYLCHNPATEKQQQTTTTRSKLGRKAKLYFNFKCENSNTIFFVMFLSIHKKYKRLETGTCKICVYVKILKLKFVPRYFESFHRLIIDRFYSTRMLMQTDSI